MSSTYKTTNLGLNQFVGSDRPKMEDFNFDNQQIDQKFQEHVLSNLHLTEQQREQLGKASYQIGSYSGDGQGQQDHRRGGGNRVRTDFYGGGGV